MPRIRSVALGAFLLTCFGIVGNIDFAEAITAEAMEKSDRVKRNEHAESARRAYEAQRQFLSQSPPVCQRRVRLYGESHYRIYVGWINSQADNDQTTTTCIYRKET
jgi:hypothetical protein